MSGSKRAPMEDHVTSLVHDSDVAIFAKTLENVILTWNPAAERLFGYSAEEMLGQHIGRMVPDDRRNEPDQLSKAIAQGERIDHVETVRIHKDGRHLHVSLTIIPSRNRQGAIYGALVLAQEIRRQSPAQRIFRQQQPQPANRALVLDTANRVALDILVSRTGVEALHHIAEACRILAGAQYAALGVAHPDGRGLLEFVTVGLTEEQERIIGPRPMGAGVLGLLLRRTQPLRLDRLGDHPSSVGFPPNHPAMESFLGVPIRRGDQVLGSLYLANKVGGGGFTEADEAAVEALGAHAAIAVYNLQMLARQRALVKGLITAQEEERRAMAYELHDGLTQYVMASHAHLESFRRAYQDDNGERATRELEQGLKYLKESVVESRRLVNGLRMLALDDLGLAGAVEQLLLEEKARAGWEEADILHNIAGRRFDRTMETAAYRVVQEALTNVRKHAEAARVRVMMLLGNDSPGGPAPLATSPAQLTITVRDWGRGFAPRQAAGDYSRMGLQGMAERVSLLGGTWELISDPGEGTRIKAIFPALEPRDETEGSIIERELQGGSTN